MFILRKDLAGIKNILNSDLFSGRKMIGRGAFCMVFEGNAPDTVLKLTIDRIAYEMIGDCVTRVDENNPHFTKVVNRFGNLGPVLLRNGSGVRFAYALECERLHKVSGNAKSLARRIQSETVTKFKEYLQRDPCHDDHLACVRALEDQSRCYSGDLGEAFDSLVTFLSNFPEGITDFHNDNFMQRSDGTLVFSDPFADIETYLGYRRGDYQHSRAFRQ